MGERKSFTYYPNTAALGIGAAVDILGQSFSVLAEVTTAAGAEGVLFKQGGAHGGHVLFIQDRRLHYIYNFMGEKEQTVSSEGTVPLCAHVLGARFVKTGTAAGSHTPVGDVTLFIDEDPVGALAGVEIHPGTFGLAGASLSIGRNSGSAVSSECKAPYPFTGGTIAQVVVDISGEPTKIWKRSSPSPSRRTEHLVGVGWCRGGVKPSRFVLGGGRHTGRGSRLY